MTVNTGSRRPRPVGPVAASAGARRGPAAQVGGEEPAEHDVLDADGGQPRQRHQRREAGRRPARWPRTPAGWSGWRRAAAATRSSPGACTRTRAAWPARSSRAAVANTTGVSRTTVASRLSTAVVTAAITNTSGQQPARAARAGIAPSTPPQARNSPSSSHRCASTKIAARKPITGPSRLASRARVAGRDRAGRDQDDRGGPGRDRLRPAPRPAHRPGQHGEQGQSPRPSRRRQRSA